MWKYECNCPNNKRAHIIRKTFQKLKNERTEQALMYTGQQETS
jgi:hypothetical protein